MSADTTSAIAMSAANSVPTLASVAIIRKAQDQQKLEGEAAVRLIEASGPQMTKTADGHLSVRA